MRHRFRGLPKDLADHDDKTKSVKPISLRNTRHLQSAVCFFFGDIAMGYSATMISSGLQADDEIEDDEQDEPSHYDFERYLGQVPPTEKVKARADDLIETTINYFLNDWERDDVLQAITSHFKIRQEAPYLTRLLDEAQKQATSDLAELDRKEAKQKADAEATENPARYVILWVCERSRQCGYVPSTETLHVEARAKAMGEFLKVKDDELKGLILRARNKCELTFIPKEQAYAFGRYVDALRILVPQEQLDSLTPRPTYADLDVALTYCDTRIRRQHGKGLAGECSRKDMIAFFKKTKPKTGLGCGKPKDCHLFRLMLDNGLIEVADHSYSNFAGNVHAKKYRLGTKHPEYHQQRIDAPIPH